MSTINTNGINVNYPIPGVNNNSQGFRDNFAAIRINLNTAGTEITDLQNKVIVKSALANSTVNNDMANTLISNALTRSFRASTFNLGNALSGVVSVNVSLGDVQYGTIAGNTTIQFTGWSPTSTQSNVQLQLAVSNNLAVLSFPSQVTDGVITLENYANIANTNTVTVPYGVTQLDYRFSTLDCGNTITVEPYNNDRIASQIQTRNVIPTGNQGDMVGDIATSTGLNQLTITSSNAADYLNTANTVQATGSGVTPQAGAGLDNVPTNGKVLEFGYGEVKLTNYGYAMDECPDSGSEIGLGNSSNMIIPLKTIAVAPETLPATPKNPNGRGLVKRGDVLIITCTDKSGNTWIERRQVGDSSGAGLLTKGVKIINLHLLDLLKINFNCYLKKIYLICKPH